MKRKLSIILFCTSLLVFSACSKGGDSGGSGGGGGNTAPPEQALSVSINPDPAGSVVAALAASYNFKLLINSTPPAAGVKIDITGLKEVDNSTQFSQTTQTSGSSITSVDLSVQNLTPGILYVIKVDVTSLTTPSNKTSISFKVARK